jgi:hypothetical protein
VNLLDLIKIYKEINKFLIELIQIHKEDIQSDVKEEIRNATDHFIEVKEQIDLILKNTLEETNKKVSKIKDIWANYFEKYDSDNLAFEKRFDKVNKTFVEWKDVVLKPLNNSNARLYAVETRINETENNVFSNLAYSTDIMKKLIFALEQENLSNRDSLVTKMLEKSDSDFKFQLHEINKHETINSRRASRDKSMDFLFIKRLLYLKNEIDENITEARKGDKSFDFSRPKTPKTLFDNKKMSHNHSEYIAEKPRGSTTVSNKNRRHVFSSMSPLRLLKSKRDSSKSKLALDNIKKNMYSRSLISGTEHSVKIMTPNNIQNIMKNTLKAKNKLKITQNLSNNHIIDGYLNDDLHYESEYLGKLKEDDL